MRRIAAFVAWRHGFGVDAGNRRGGGSPHLWRGGMGLGWMPGIAEAADHRICGVGSGFWGAGMHLAEVGYLREVESRNRV
jgi:hypothetical protein